jgi:hypothetical protein
MPDGTIGRGTLASSAITSTAESLAVTVVVIPPGLLVPGPNIIAAEVSNRRRGAWVVGVWVVGSLPMRSQVPVSTLALTPCPHPHHACTDPFPSPPSCMHLVPANAVLRCIKQR